MQLLLLCILQQRRLVKFHGWDGTTTRAVHVCNPPNLAASSSVRRRTTHFEKPRDDVKGGLQPGMILHLAALAVDLH